MPSTAAARKALLVWPKFSSFSFWNFEKVCELAGVKYMTPPLGLLTVAALLPASWSLRVVDENVRALSDSDLEWADIVLVSSKIVHRRRALDVVRMAKARGRPVAVGGPDPTLNEGVYERAGADYMCLDVTIRHGSATSSATSPAGPARSGVIPAWWPGPSGAS
jgi:radical SAM superfamily enzyme YgiQ (UPF0313 family)